MDGGCRAYEGPDGIPSGPHACTTGEAGPARCYTRLGAGPTLLHACAGPRADRPPEQQHDDRADDRAEQTREGEVETVTIVLKQQVPEEPTDRRAHGTQHDGADDPN